MPGLLDIGNKPGEAAPGEYGPGALLLSSGLVVMRDPTTLLPAAKFPPGYPIVDLGRASTPSDTAEHSLMAGSAALAGVLGSASNAVKDFWHVKLSGTILNNSGTSSYTTRLRAYFGAYAAGDATSGALVSSATTREWTWDLYFLIETLGAAGTGTLRVSEHRLGIDNPLGTGTGARNPANVNMYTERAAESTGTSSSPALITNAAQDFNVTATHSNATALMTTALTECIVRHYPQNR